MGIKEIHREYQTTLTDGPTCVLYIKGSGAFIGNRVARTQIRPEVGVPPLHLGAVVLNPIRAKTGRLSFGSSLPVCR